MQNKIHFWRLNKKKTLCLSTTSSNPPIFSTHIEEDNAPPLPAEQPRSLLLEDPMRSSKTYIVYVSNWFSFHLTCGIWAPKWPYCFCSGGHQSDSVTTSGSAKPSLSVLHNVNMICVISHLNSSRVSEVQRTTELNRQPLINWLKNESHTCSNQCEWPFSRLLC